MHKLSSALIATTIVLTTLPATAQLSTDYSTSVIVLNSVEDGKCYKGSCLYNVSGTIRNNTNQQVIGVSVEIGSDFNGKTESIGTLYATPARIMPGGTGNFSIPVDNTGRNTRVLSVTWYTPDGKYQGYQPVFFNNNYYCNQNICSLVYPR